MVHTVRDIPSLSGSTVLLRAPLNEPVKNGEITSDFRLRRMLPTVKFLTKAGAKVIICGHIGRAPTETLAPVYRALAKRIPRISFSSEIIGASVHDAVSKLPNGDVLMLENLRRNSGEKENDKTFAQALASLADIFVQDAFDTCHRMHASIVGVPKLLPSYAGLLLDEEISALSGARSPEHPALSIIGGAKFETKEPVIKTLLDLYDNVAVGGALANDFLLAEGYSMGASRVSDVNFSAVHLLVANKKLVLPSDIVVAKKNEDATKKETRVLDTVGIDEGVYDIGPKTRLAFTSLARDAKTILWNGPLGFYEKGFTDGDSEIAYAISESDAHSIVGGGDTVAEIEKLGLSEKFSFVSTGGGAMLDFLTEGILVGIRALD